MVIEKITSILQKTAQISNYPPEVVADVVTYVFKYIKGYVSRPTKAGLRILLFGIIRPTKRANYNYLAILLKRMRKDRNNEKLKEEFRVF